VIETKITCDRCGTEQVVSSLAPWWPLVVEGRAWTRLTIASADVDHVEVYVCPACAPQLVELVPRAREVARAIAADYELDVIANDRVRILPNQSAQLTDPLPADLVAFRVRRLVIEDRPEDWRVEDVLIGNRSLPGEVFAKDASASDVVFDTLRDGMTYSVIVTYVGKNPEGCRFSGKLRGVAVKRPV